ncbi:MAG: sigma-54 dependent transcriptional regulator [Vicinamibacterales bacterium]
MLVNVCARLRARLGALSAAFVVSGDADAPVVVASDGSRLDSGTAARVYGTTALALPHRGDERAEAFAPVRYAGHVAGWLVAVWPPTGKWHDADVTLLMTTAATASAPALAGLASRRASSRRAGGGSELLGVSPAIVNVRAAIEKAAPAPFAVLIEGESGSGKELVARLLHKHGPRRDRPFSTLNCAALPEDLVESELFGHARGAFTGAVAERRGVFEEAHSGTLFLDEVGELSARAQAKLLRAIQEGEIRRVGENTCRRVDVRLITATNRDLRAEVAAGRFRLDLLYRLDVIRVVLPPLRDRREDIAVLAEHFWRSSAERIGSRAELSSATLSVLTKYDWPGNIRELQNVLAALAVRSPRRGLVPPAALPTQFTGAVNDDSSDLEAARRTFDRAFIRAALVRTGGHRARAAAELGVSRQGLAKLMARLDIDDPGDAAEHA